MGAAQQGPCLNSGAMHCGHMHIVPWSYALKGIAAEEATGCHPATPRASYLAVLLRAGLQSGRLAR